MDVQRGLDEHPVPLHKDGGVVTGRRGRVARTAAGAIRNGTSLMEQRRETGEFVRQAGEALRLTAQR